MAGKGLRETKKPPAALPVRPAAADGGEFALLEKGEEFESCRLVKTSQKWRFCIFGTLFLFYEAIFLDRFLFVADFLENGLL